MRIFWEQLRTSSVLGALIALTLLTGALGVYLSPTGSTEVAEASDGTVAVVEGNNYFCDPALGNDVDPSIYCETTIHVGDSIEWTNSAGFHDATECGSGWSKWGGATCVAPEWASGFMPPGATFTQAFGTAGTYDYLCTIHGLSMKARVVVVEDAPPPTSAPTATPTPSVTTTPTATLAPTPTAPPSPAATQASPTPSESSAPTLIPTPTQASSFTPAPTSSPSATASPEPAGDPTPTALPAFTAQVTATPTPSATPDAIETSTPSANSGVVAGLPSSGGIPGIGSGFGVGGLLLIADIGLALVTAAAFGWFVGRRASG